MVSVTALGELDGRAPVLRSGARAGDVVAVSGSLGLSGAGLHLLEPAGPTRTPRRWPCTGDPGPRWRWDRWPPRRARPRWSTSPTASSATPPGSPRRVGSASTSAAALEGDVARLAPALGAELALESVLGGGEEHSLLATFPAGSAVPEGFRVVGAVRPGGGVALDGVPQARGWDHFGG